MCALHEAAASDDISLVERLIRAGEGVDGRDETHATAIHWAVRVGNAEMCSMLVRAGAPLDATDKYGSTALHFAAKDQNEEICRLLLAAGASHEGIGAHGIPALESAITVDSVSICRVFEKFVPGVFTTKAKGAERTPFQQAVAVGAHAVVETWVKEFGADLSQLTGAGESLDELAPDEGMQQLLRALKAEVVVGAAIAVDESVVAVPRRSQLSL